MSTLNTNLNYPGTLQSSVPLTGTITTASSNTITLNPNYGWGTTTGTWTIGPSIYNNGISYGTPSTQIFPSQSAIFIIDEGSQKDADTLAGRFNDIVGDEMHFFPQINGKNIEPLETVMRYIKSQKKIELRLTRVGYDIKLKGVTFKSIRNLLSKDSDTVLKVVFEYEQMIYDNTLLTLEEKRSQKVKEIAKNIKRDDI